MFWKLWAAVLLLAWINAPSQIEAAKITEYEILQPSDAEELPSIQTGTLLKYPSVSYIKSTYPRGGYSRRRSTKRGKDAATTTTERPFIRVWNNILRSVQPNFRIFNITNPLTNIFNNGNSNIIETVPMNALMTNEEEQEPTEGEDEEEEETTTTTKKPRMKKRKRKHQKRRPTFEDQVEPSLDYYGVTLPLAVNGQQPLFYYGPNMGSYINMRRIHAKIYQNQLYESENSDEEFIPVDNLREIDTQQLNVLRPVKFALKAPSVETAIVDEINDAYVTVANDVISSAANEDVDSAEKVVADTKGKAHLSSTASNDVAPFSESMRNALGTHMSDDRQNQQRQRQSDRKSVTVAPAKEKPRQNQQFYLLHAW